MTEAEAAKPGAVPDEGLGAGVEEVGGALPPALPDAPHLCDPGDFGVARMLGHKSLVVTLEKYKRFMPNLTREDDKALLAAGEILAIDFLIQPGSLSG